MTASAPERLETTSHRIDGHRLHEHRLAVPLDHARPHGGETLEVFAREVVRDGGEDRPRLIWFQGGPGNRANRPESIGGWLDRALEEYRVVLLDQRGTGLSTPADRQTLAEIGDAAAQARYLAHFRADAIVGDAECLRRALGVTRWSVLGQSFGGFIATAYLSAAPASLREVLITAGLPALTGAPDRVYELTFAQTARRNGEFAQRYPQDAATLRDVAAHLRETDERLPSGERLSVRRLLLLGIALGSATGLEGLHYLLEDPFTTVHGSRRLRERFLREVGAKVSFAGNPLYALLHETIYAQGAASEGATRWSAERVRAQLPAFDPDLDAPLLTGEHIFPWQFEEDPALVPLRETAHLLAEREDFPALYDPEVLAHNEVPVAAAVYHDDMFVPRELSLRTAASTRGLRPLITNEYQHDGIRVDGRHLLDRLLTTLRR
ncbi:alpha/beta hydrolase [Brachybacterium huguangmaarense]|uniref:Alpha/beta hydrolase n=1 Tax=Brachybacterium huguangmaarense TaxID=1652028 RepID=A0ABY6FYK1_9MICO|nr:alpha/beta hydrolase [Brachybacterium huguangmaarense]UYG16000.1 alpha/beta hydrolase [Brachybacterium huguangmaarense]